MTAIRWAEPGTGQLLASVLAEWGGALHAADARSGDLVIVINGLPFRPAAIVESASQRPPGSLYALLEELQGYGDLVDQLLWLSRPNPGLDDLCPLCALAQGKTSTALQVARMDRFFIR